MLPDKRELVLSYEDQMHRAREGLLAFTRYTMPDFEINWHHRVFARHLNMVERGEIKRLIIESPPRHAKSELTSRRFPAYYLGRNPDHHIIAASYGMTLAESMSRDVQRIIDSDRYRQIFENITLSGPHAQPTVGGSWKRGAGEFQIVGYRGRYKAVGVGSAVTGLGGQLILIDDPTKDMQTADSAKYQQSVWDWYQSTLYTRLEKDARIVLVMTRWGVDDLAGKLLKRAEEQPEADQWVRVRLPAFNEDGPSEHDPRQIGEALWPGKYDERSLARIQAGMAPRIFNALYQQRPAPQEGGIVKLGWWRFYTRLPEAFDGWGLSCDLTFKDAEKSDFAVFQVWARVGADCYLIDQVRRRMDFTEQLETMRMLSAKYPQVLSKWVEDAANGAALVSLLKHEIPGLIPVTPKGSKIARLESVAPLIKAGNVYLPDSSIASWVSQLLDEVSTFPNGQNDDVVDALSLSLSNLQNIDTFDWLPGNFSKTSQFLNGL